MENATLDDVIIRLDRLEETMTELRDQVSVLVDHVVKQKEDELRTGEQVMAHFGKNKDQHTKLVQEVFDIMDINGEPIPAEELQARIEKNGIRAAENEFSRETIEKESKTETQEYNNDLNIGVKVIEGILEQLGYPPDYDPGTVEELYESMKQSGIRAEDNEFSRAIIMEREK